jgi:signal transduction histidine kinase
MPRAHCLRKADGTPDWPWIISLIALNIIIVSGYLRIVFFWRRCYLDEKVEDRDRKLKSLACIFVLCATCGYAFAIIMFFWPVYRLQAIVLVGLAIVTWRFAIDLEPFRQSFTARRLQRELNVALQNENEELESKNRELTRMHHELTHTLEELRHTNKELDQFVYATSHDLRSPLRAIESLAQFVIEDAADALPEGAASDLRQLQSRAQRMERMLNGLLNYSRSRQRSFDWETFTIAEVVREAAELLDIPDTFDIVLPENTTEIVSPKAPLGQVLRNLIDNAIKHHDRDRGQVSIEVNVEEHFIRFDVSDDGPGIDPADQERVFQMFTTLSRRDDFDTNGMGLALVRRVVEAHGGVVRLVPSKDRGATFQFSWPRELLADQPIQKTHPTPDRVEACCV